MNPARPTLRTLRARIRSGESAAILLLVAACSTALSIAGCQRAPSAAEAPAAEAKDKGAPEAEGARWQPAIERAVLQAATSHRIATDSPGRMRARRELRAGRAGFIGRPFMRVGGAAADFRTPHRRLARPPVLPVAPTSRRKMHSSRRRVPYTAQPAPAVAPAGTARTDRGRRTGCAAIPAA